MAIWAGATVNTNELAAVFNQLANKKLVPMVRRHSPLFTLLTGEADSGFLFDGKTNPYAAFKAQRMRKITGHNIEVRLRGALLSGLATVADGSAEYATATPDYGSAKYGAAEFAITHYAHNVAFPSHEIDRFAGDEAKTMDWIDDEFEGLALGIAKEVETQIGGANATSRTQLGGWQYAVSDGVSTGETSYATYGLIDRSDSGNADFRGNNDVTGGTLTTAKIRAQRLLCNARGGQPNLGVAGRTVYDIVYALVEPYAHVTYDEKMAEFGSENVKYQGVTYLFDNYTSSGVLGLLDTSTFMFYMKDKNFVKSYVQNAPWLVASDVLNYELWCQLVCMKPNSNAKLTSIVA